MSEEVFETALKRMQEIRYAGIVDFIFYNEPLLDPRLPELVERLKAAVPNCLPRVTTNGDALTEALLLRLTKAGVLTFYVTRHVPVKPGWNERIEMLVKKYPQYITLTDIMEIQAKTGLWTRAGLVKVEKEYKVKSCYTPEGALVIDRNGEALLCCCDYFHKHSQGNIMKQGILEIWRGYEFTRIRRNLHKGVPILDICKNCILRLKS
jgi:MoaA/NifB/PqqE/SkfB family radical SAM enzyme